MTASPDHRVDARSAAQNLPHAQGNSAAVELRVRLGLELPVSLASDVRDPLARIRDAWYVIVATGFQQQDTHTRVFRETTRNYRPEEPDPQITKSYCVLRLDLSFR